MTNDRSDTSLLLNLGSAPHHKTLPEAMARCGILRRGVRYGQELEILESENGRIKLIHRVPYYRLGTRIIWAVWRRLPLVVRSSLPMVLWSGVVDKLMSRWLVPAAVFHGLAGSTPYSLRAAKRLSARTIIDNSFLHPTAWEQEMSIDCREVGIDPNKSEHSMCGMMLRRLERQYRECDRIISVFGSGATLLREALLWFSEGHDVAGSRAEGWLSV